jgi:chromate transport protein ChrA
MKVLGRWATVGFAVLAVVLGAVVALVAVRFMIPATQDLDLYGRLSNGTRVAIISLVSTRGVHGVRATRRCRC